jgi:hypothetical protein
MFAAALVGSMAVGREIINPTPEVGQGRQRDAGAGLLRQCNGAAGVALQFLEKSNDAVRQTQ